MRKLSLMIVIALVLGLLVAVSTPVSAGKPNPAAEKSKNVSKGQPAENKPDKTTPPGQAKPDKPGKTGEGVAPDDIPEPGENAGRMVVICHKPGTPAEQTLVLPESAVAGHMRHGDTEGPCLAQSSILTSTAPITPTVPPVTPTLALSNTVMVSICHKPGTPAEKTLWLPASAIPGHLGHGDFRGACPRVGNPADLHRTDYADDSHNTIPGSHLDPADQHLSQARHSGRKDTLAARVRDPGSSGTWRRVGGVPGNHGSSHLHPSRHEHGAGHNGGGCYRHGQDPDLPQAWHGC